MEPLRQAASVWRRSRTFFCGGQENQVQQNVPQQDEAPGRQLHGAGAEWQQARRAPFGPGLRIRTRERARLGPHPKLLGVPTASRGEDGGWRAASLGTSPDRAGVSRGERLGQERRVTKTTRAVLTPSSHRSPVGPGGARSKTCVLGFDSLPARRTFPGFSPVQRASSHSSPHTSRRRLRQSRNPSR